MLRVFESSGMLQRATATIEFGAGKGELTEQVRGTIAALSNDAAADGGIISVLIDRNSKLPSWAGKRECWERSPDVHCRKVDIRNMYLPGEATLAGRHSIGIGKHVCGAATDLALRCLCHSSEASATPSSHVIGVGIALCCRHACNWEDYVDQSWILDSGFSVQEFGALTHMSSWAHQPVERKRQLGRLCKRFLDAGRVRFLRKHGFRAVVREYAAPVDTEENQLLLAVRDAQMCCPCAS